MLAAADWTAARELPGLLRQIIEQFPELKAAPALAMPLGDPKVVARGTGRAVQAEAQGNTREREPLDSQELKELPVQPGPPEPEAVTIADALRRAIRPRFAIPKGGVEVVAPGRPDRREAARGDGIPFRLDLPGRSAPRPQVVICHEFAIALPSFFRRQRVNVVLEGEDRRGADRGPGHRPGGA